MSRYNLLLPQHKQIIMVELTVPWETTIPQQPKNKNNKYYDLEAATRMKDSAHTFYSGGCCRGLHSKNIYDFFKNMRFGRKKISENVNPYH